MAKHPWFNFRFKVKFYVLLLTFHSQTASVLCDETVEGTFGFHLVLFPVPAHQPHSYLPTCAGVRRRQDPEGLQRKAEISSFRTILELSQSFNLKVVLFLLLSFECVKKGLLSRLF